MPQVAAFIAAKVGAIVFATASSAGASVTTAATIANAAYAAAYVGSYIGMSAAASYATRPNLETGKGSSTDWKADTRAGVPYAIGETAVAGNIVFRTVTGEKNRYQLFYNVLSLDNNEAPFGDFTANGEIVTLGADAGEGAIGDLRHRFWMKRAASGDGPYAGLRFVSTGTKDTPGDHGGNAPEWTAEHRLTGYTVSAFALSFDANVYSSGPPQPLQKGKWAKVYDPRLDGTYPGGAGPQRSNNEATWAYSENPFLHALTWCLGRHRNGKRVIGIGAPIAALDVPSFVEAANVADANGWKVGGQVSSQNDKWDVLTALCQAGGGEPMRLGAMISVFVNTPRVSLATLSGADIDGDASITAAQARRDRFNTVIPVYRSEAHGWEMVPADPVTVAEYVVTDRGERSREIEYPLVQSVDQAAQLAMYDIVNAREFGPVILPVRPRWMGLKPGDAFTVDEPELAMEGQKVIVRSRNIDAQTASRVLTCRSETDAKHDFALGKTGVAPPTPGLTPPSVLPAAPGAGAWTVIATTITRAGVQMPVVIVTGEVDDPSASEILVGSRLLDLDGNPVDDGEFNWTSSPARSVRIELTGLAPHAHYQIAVRYKTIRGAEDKTVWLDLGEVEIPGIVVTAAATAYAAETIAGQTPAEIYNNLLSATAAAQDAWRKLAGTTTLLGIEQFLADDRLKSAFGYTREGLPLGGFAEYTKGVTDDLVFDRKLLGVRKPDGTGFILDDDTVSYKNGDTVAQRTALLYAASANAAAAVVTESQARASGDQANAALTQALSATVSTGFSNLNGAIINAMNVAATATGVVASNLASVSTTVDALSANVTLLAESIDGIGASWTLAVVSSGPGYARVAGIKAAASPDVSSLIFMADEIGFANDAGDDVFPLAVVDGIVKASNFQADRVEAGSIVADSIVGGEVTDSGAVVDVTNQALGGGETTIASLSYTSAGGRLAITSQLDVGGTGTPGTDVGITTRLYCDGSLLDEFPWKAPNGFTDFRARNSEWTPGAGAHTLQLRAFLTAGGGANKLTGSIRLTEYRNG